MAVRGAALEWKEASARGLERGDEGLTTVLAAVAHLAYHLGAIRQIHRAARGPAANE